MRGIRKHVATGLSGFALASLPGCAGLVDGEASRRLPSGYRLVEKQQLQALYGPDGRIERLLRDADGDGRAEVVVLYRESGTPERAELDTDGNGRVDRWELFRADGTLEAVAVSRHRGERPDQWDWAAPDGRVRCREIDDNGDGLPDHGAEPD